MKTQELNVFIVAENALVANGLKHYLKNRFGSAVNLSCFFDSKTCLKNIDASTDVLVLDHEVEGARGTDLLRSAQSINPRSQGIFHTSSSDVGASIQVILDKETRVQPSSKKFVFRYDDQYSHYYARF